MLFYFWVNFGAKTADASLLVLCERNKIENLWKVCFSRYLIILIRRCLLLWPNGRTFRKCYDPNKTIQCAQQPRVVSRVFNCIPTYYYYIHTCARQFRRITIRIHLFDWKNNPTLSNKLNVYIHIKKVINRGRQ